MKQGSFAEQTLTTEAAIAKLSTHFIATGARSYRRYLRSKLDSDKPWNAVVLASSSVAKALGYRLFSSAFRTRRGIVGSDRGLSADLSM